MKKFRLVFVKICVNLRLICSTKDIVKNDFELSPNFYDKFLKFNKNHVPFSIDSQSENFYIDVPAMTKSAKHLFNKKTKQSVSKEFHRNKKLHNNKSLLTIVSYMQNLHFKVLKKTQKFCCCW